MKPSAKKTFIIVIIVTIVLASVAVGLWQGGVFGGSTANEPTPPAGIVQSIIGDIEFGDKCTTTKLQSLTKHTKGTAITTGSMSFSGVNRVLFGLTNVDDSATGSYIYKMQWHIGNHTGTVSRGNVRCRSDDHKVQSDSVAAISDHQFAFISVPTTESGLTAATSSNVIVRSTNDHDQPDIILTYTLDDEVYKPLVVHFSSHRKELYVLWYSSDAGAVILASYPYRGYKIISTPKSPTVTINDGSVVPTSMTHISDDLLIGGNGKVYHYKWTNVNGWSLLDTITQSDSFGFRTSMSSDRLFLATCDPEGDSGNGSLYLYSRTTTNDTWTLDNTYTTGSDGITSYEGNDLGWTVAWSNHELFAGKVGSIVRINADTGAVTMWTDGPGKEIGDCRYIGGFNYGERNILGFFDNADYNMYLYTQCESLTES